jgi:hypothetical protein
MNKSLIAYEVFLNQIGSTWMLDSLYLFLITPLSIFGVLLNIFTLVGLCKTSNNGSNRSIAYFQYLKVYTLNSIIVCGLLALSFCSRSQRYISFSYSYLSRFYRCKITYSLYAFYFYGNILAILIKFERLSMLHLKTFFKQKPYTLSFILFIVAFSISFPTFFVYHVKSDVDFEDALLNRDNKSFSFVYCGRNPFYETLNGKIIFLTINIIRSFITLVIEIIVSTFFIISHRKFFHTKHRLLNVNNNSFNNIDETLRLNNLSRTNLNTDKKSLNFKHGGSKYIDNLNRKITLMTIFLSLISILGLIGSFLVVIIFLIINNGFIFHFVVFVNVLTVIFIYILNFFLLYAFNCNFRNYFKSFFQ